MADPKFILSKKILKEQIDKLKDLGLKISYSYKTNREVGNVIQDLDDEVCFSIHAREEVDMIYDKSKIWFFTQAESEGELKDIFDKGIRNFVVDNEIDLERLLKVIENFSRIRSPPSFPSPTFGREVNKKSNIARCDKINLSLRMKFKEHRIGSGKYFVYGMPSKKVNELIFSIYDNKFVDKLGVHIHRKSQNTSEWDIKNEIKDSLQEETLKKIDFLNFGGGLPTRYRGYTANVFDYIFLKIKEAKEFLDGYGIESWIEPGRFFASPCIKLETEIIQIQENNVIVNTTIYNCALDTILTGTKMLVEDELEDSEEGNYYLIKGNSPTRDDIFRYKVKLKEPKVGDKIVFLNAGAYNYTTDFFGYKKLNTKVVD